MGTQARTTEKFDEMAYVGYPKSAEDRTNMILQGRMESGGR